MRRTRLAMIFCSALLLASPAIAHDAGNAKPAQSLPDAALPAPLDRVLRDYEQAWRTGDAKALAALFAEDGFVLQSNQPPVRGRSVIEAACAGQGGSPLRLRALGIRWRATRATSSVRTATATTWAIPASSRSR